MLHITTGSLINTMGPAHITRRKYSLATFAARVPKLIALFMVLYPVSGYTETFFGDPDNYDVLIDQLGPGDVLELSAGDYTRGLNIKGLSGSAGQPIIIRGPENTHSAVIHGRACCNTVQIENSSYVTVEWLKVDGGNVGGIDGVNGRGHTHDITIANLLIVRHGTDQQDVGISTKGSAWDWIVRNNTILSPGTGMYFGDSDGSAPFVRGLVEYNYVEDSIGYNMEIKHQNARPANIGLPTGDSVTIIRHNVFTKENNSSTGGLARPNLLVGHFPLSGDGSNDTYEIYGNFLFENPSESLFQGEGNIHFHNNVLFNSAGDAIQIVPHKDRPRKVVVAFNTVLSTGRGIRISGAETGYQQVVVGNLVFADLGISAPVERDNILDSYASADTYLESPFLSLGEKSLFPLAGAATGQQIVLDDIVGVQDINLDFNGMSRLLEFRGAYSGEGTNPGWVLARSHKGAVSQDVGTPSVNLSADRQTVTVTESVQLSWSSTNASSCFASGSWSGQKSTSGSESVAVNNEGSNQFVLECSGQGGSASASTTVTGEAQTPPPAPPAPPQQPDDNSDDGDSGGGGFLDGASLLALFLAALWRVIALQRARWSLNRPLVRSALETHPGN